MGRQHFHKYRRVNIGRDVEYWVMQCQSAGCNHYHPMKTKRSCPSLIGKTTICNKCEGLFEFDKRSIEMAKPTCFSCVDGPKKRRIMAAAKFLNEIEKADAEVK